METGAERAPAQEGAPVYGPLPASHRRSRRWVKSLLLLVILVPAFLLRGLSLSHYPGREEARLITDALAMQVEGERAAGSTRQGPLAHYCLVGVAATCRTLGLVPGFGEIWREWQSTPPGVSTVALRLARLTAILLGLLAVTAVFFAGFQCGGLFGGAAAAMTLAAAPLAVRQGRLLSPELASAAMTAVGIALAIWAIRKRRFLAGLAAALFFGFAFGGQAFGALLFLPLLVIYMDLVQDGRRRLRQGFGLGLAFALGLLLACARQALDFAWWVGFLQFHLAGPATPLFGLEGEATGWVFYITRILPYALSFPLLSLAGVVGLFFGMRSGKYEWRFLFWSGAILFVFIGGVQVRTARSALPLAVLMAVGVGLFAASSRHRLQNHPGAAVVSLVMAVMLLFSVPDLFREALVLGREDTRTRARRFLAREAGRGGSLRLLAMLPVATSPPVGAAPSPRRCLDAYPELQAPRFQVEALCRVKHRPVLDHRLWSMLDGASNLLWDYYIWSGWAEGVMAERGEAHFGGPLAAFRKVRQRGKLVAEFGLGGGAAQGRLAEAHRRVVAGSWADRPGPYLRIYRLRPRPEIEPGRE